MVTMVLILFSELGVPLRVTWWPGVEEKEGMGL